MAFVFIGFRDWIERLYSLFQLLLCRWQAKIGNGPGQAASVVAPVFFAMRVIVPPWEFWANARIAVQIACFRKRWFRRPDLRTDEGIVRGWARNFRNGS